MHTFISECAPPCFLRVKPFKLLKIFAKPIKWLLEKQSVREKIWKLNNSSILNIKLNFLNRSRKRRLKRVISFLNTSAQLGQREIFERSLETAKAFDSNPRLLALTMDMDYMDTQSKPLVNYTTQLYEVLQIKQLYPDNIFPFIGVDPRAKSGKELVEWIKFYFKNGVKSKLTGKIIPFCSGIKIYPAHGFFPFDTRLDKLYKYAERKKIPIMSHCTRVGSQYIGSEIEKLIPGEPNMIMPDENDRNVFNKAKIIRNEIYKRIDRYYGKKTWIRNSVIGENDYACDLFSHPQNYVPIMLKYPDLKICLAHMGGTEEVENMNLFNPGDENWMNKAHADKELKEIWRTDKNNWAYLIKELMKEYVNFYTDISSTISDLNIDQVSENIKDWANSVDTNKKMLGYRILFGTDFFMTEIEKSESVLYELIQKKLADKWFHEMAYGNIERYLNQ